MVFGPALAAVGADSPVCFNTTRHPDSGIVPRHMMRYFSFIQNRIPMAEPEYDQDNKCHYCQRKIEGKVGYCEPCGGVWCDACCKFRWHLPQSLCSIQYSAETLRLADENGGDMSKALKLVAEADDQRGGYGLRPAPNVPRPEGATPPSSPRVILKDRDAPAPKKRPRSAADRG